MEWFLIGMTIAKDIGMANVSFLKIDKTEEERAIVFATGCSMNQTEEKTKYNSFMNFMTDIIVKYGLNEKLDEDR